MAFEIRSAAAVLLLFVFATANLVEKSAGATTYVVGDSLGWTIPAGGAGSYDSWASGHTFSPGDVLLFNFPTGVHDVAKVDKASFDSCSASNPTTLATVGPATITLLSPGEHYFICTFGQHCSLGQKLTLKVSGASTTPAPSPNATATAPPPAAVATPPTAAAAAPKSTPSSTPPSATSSSPPTAAPNPATPSTATTPPAKSPAVTPSSATPPSSTRTPPTTAPAPTAGGINPGGPEIPATAPSPGGRINPGGPEIPAAPSPGGRINPGGPEIPASGPGGAVATAPGPSDSSHPPPAGSATKTSASSTVLGLIVAIAGSIAFIGY